MDVLEMRDKEGKQVTVETKAAKAAAEAEAARLAEQEAVNGAKAKGSKKGKSKSKGKASNAAVQETVEEGDDVEDEVMAAAVEELLKTVNGGNVLSSSTRRFLILAFPLVYRAI